MRPRDLGSPGSRRARTTCLFAAAIALILVPTGIAHATIGSISVIPPAPESCESTTVRVAGTLTSSCESLRSSTISGPTVVDLGGVPVSRFDVTVWIEGMNPQLEIPCANDHPPYSIDFPVGLLQPGPYAVRTIEYHVPFGVTTPDDSTSAAFRFGVAPGDTCPPGPPCSLLGFLPGDGTILPPPPNADRAVACDGFAPPGGRGCIAIGLMNPVPVGGVQVEFAITDLTAGPLPAGTFTPLAVETTPRTQGFTVTWSAEGATVKAVLYSATGATIAPGRGPILRACYGVSSDTREMAFPIFFHSSLVADSNGKEIPPCPTFAQIQGWFCVGSPPSSCDLNGDGRSDIRDVILLVRCALAGAGTDACPDSIATRADCNGDAMIDVRDVICCVRKILAAGLLPPPPAGTNGTPTRIGFAGPAVWMDAAEGQATIEVAPAPGFAGAQFVVAPGAGVRIRNVSLQSSPPGANLEWSLATDGAAHVMLYGMAYPVASAPPASGVAELPTRILVMIEPSDGAGAPASTLTLQSLGGADWQGAAAAAESTQPTAEVPATAVSAAAVYPARPNPFAGETEISFALPAASHVSLRLYDVSGRLVRTLVDGSRDPGVHHVRWDGRNDAGGTVVSGIYFVKFSANGVTRSDRILKLR